MKINRQAYGATLNTLLALAGAACFFLALVSQPLLTLAGTALVAGIYRFWDKRLR